MHNFHERVLKTLYANKISRGNVLKASETCYIREQGSTFTFACEIPYIASSLFNMKCAYFYTVTYMMIEKDQ